ncbi:MAG: ACP S-malonyltransferase [Deltaproteobacteria bacterium]|nr:MAG: ACP S-malonyltransferase [Deltaproteobacteria bacterium]
MATILIDHNIEGQAMMLWRMLRKDGWSELVPLEFVILTEAGMREDSTDREVWRFAQKNGMILLTANRRMMGKDSLEQTIREENTPASLPVLTIGSVRRMIERSYRERCKMRLLEVVLYPESYLGTARIFIP